MHVTQLRLAVIKLTLAVSKEPLSPWDVAILYSNYGVYVAIMGYTRLLHRVRSNVPVIKRNT